MSQNKRSLTASQIQYLRIGPKVADAQSKRNLAQVLSPSENDQSEMNPSNEVNLNKISKYTYGNFERTVNNFGVLINKNFGSETSIHQIQKFGALAKEIDPHLRIRPIIDRATQQNSRIIDTRINIKTIYEFNGVKLMVAMRGFSVTNKVTDEHLTLASSAFIVAHIPGNKLSKAIEVCGRNQGNKFSVDHEKLTNKFGNMSNTEPNYASETYNFERNGQQYTIHLPVLQVTQSQLRFKKSFILQNEDILSVIEKDFENVEEIMNKYVDPQMLQKVLLKTAGHKAPIAEDDQDEAQGLEVEVDVEFVQVEQEKGEVEDQRQMLGDEDENQILAEEDDRDEQKNEEGQDGEKEEQKQEKEEQKQEKEEEKQEQEKEEIDLQH